MCAPVLAFLTVGVADIGRSFYYKEAVTNTTRQVIRLAARSQAIGNAGCAANGGNPVTRSVPDLTGGGDIIAPMINSAALETSSDGTNATSALNNPANATKIILTWHCNGGAARNNSTATSSDPASSGSDSIEAKIDYSFSAITPLFGSTPIHIVSDVRGRAEYP